MSSLDTINLYATNKADSNITGLDIISGTADTFSTGFEVLSASDFVPDSSKQWVNTIGGLPSYAIDGVSIYASEDPGREIAGTIGGYIGSAIGGAFGGWLFGLEGLVDSGASGFVSAGTLGAVGLGFAGGEYGQDAGYYIYDYVAGLPITTLTDTQLIDQATMITAGSMPWDYNNDDNVIDLGTIEVNASSDDIVFHDDPFMTDDGDIYMSDSSYYYDAYAFEVNAFSDEIIFYDDSFMTDNGDIYMSDPSYYYDPFAFSYATPV